MVFAYMRAMLAGGMQASLLLPEDGLLADDMRVSDLHERCFYLPTGWRWMLWCFPFFRSRVKNYLRAADLIIVHNALLATPLRRLTRAPIAAVNHLNKTRRMQHCDAVINLNGAMQRKMRSNGGVFEHAPERSLLLVNGLLEIPPMPERGGREGCVPVVGYAGALESFKGCFDLLDAAVRIEEPLRLIFCGEGSARGALEARARGLRHPVEFRGHLPDLSDFYAECDIFCFPSHNEPFGLTLTEAMSFCLPPVVGAVGGAADIIRDGEEGLLFTPGDADMLAKQLRVLIRDAGRRHVMGGNARRAVLAHCAPRVFSRQLCATIRTIVALGRK